MHRARRGVDCRFTGTLVRLRRISQTLAALGRQAYSVNHCVALGVSNACGISDGYRSLRDCVIGLNPIYDINRENRFGMLCVRVKVATLQMSHSILLSWFIGMTPSIKVHVFFFVYVDVLCDDDNSSVGVSTFSLS